jgi:hypothetical protein
MSVSAPLRRLKGAPALRPAALSAARLVIAWGRLGAAKPRLLTVSHGNQRTVGTAAPPPYRAVMGPKVRIWHARG